MRMTKVFKIFYASELVKRHKILVRQKGVWYEPKNTRVIDSHSHLTH